MHYTDNNEYIFNKLSIVLQISLLLGLHLDNCLHEVLMPDNITIASQRQHARLNADGLALGACFHQK